MATILNHISNYIVQRNIDHQYLQAKWLVIGVNEVENTWVIDSWVDTKKQALAIANDYNTYLTRPSPTQQ